jgi:hypothetical protein
MKLKILLVAIGVPVFLLYLSGCSKNNAVQLSGGATCDTTNVKYSTQVLPILQNNCYRCHQGPGASSGIDFSNYADFKGWSESGYVVGDITSAPDFTPMPYGGPPLSTCEINTIVAWIHQGMQNN